VAIKRAPLASLLPKNCVVKTWCDDTDVSSLGREYPDEKWHFVDRAGHSHAWEVRSLDGDGYPRGFLPTASWVIDVPGTDEYPEEGHYECALCGERIRPGYVIAELRPERFRTAVAQSVELDLPLKFWGTLSQALRDATEIEIQEYIPAVRGRCRVQGIEHRAGAETLFVTFWAAGRLALTGQGEEGCL